MRYIRKYIVYKHTCPNSKIYIGITNQKAEYRWGNNGNGYKNQLFYRAIQKYGWDNITHEILYSELSREEAEKYEKELINTFKSYDRQYGYNIDYGGGGTKQVSEETKEKLRQANIGKKYSEETKKKISKALTGRLVTEETKRKISESNKGKQSHFLGMHHTEETKQKLSEDRTGEGNPMYKKHHTEEAKQKISLANMGNKKRLGQKHSDETKQKMRSSAKRGVDNHKSRRVICENTGDIFNSMNEAAAWINMNRSSGISACCRGKNQTCGKHPDTGEPLRWSYYEEVINE